MLLHAPTPSIHHVCLGRENDPKYTTPSATAAFPTKKASSTRLLLHARTPRSAGSVGGVRNIKNVCLVARKVYEHSGHVMLCADGAYRFARDLGFPHEDLLTEDARKIWMLWKENNSQMDWWGPSMTEPGWKDPYAGRPAPKPTIDLHGMSRNSGAPATGSSDPEHSEESLAQTFRPGVVPRHPTPEWADTIRLRTQKLVEMAADLGIAPEDRLYAAEQILWPTTGTIHVSVVNTKGEMSGATTTSGLAWKLPGRLGDSPILGAGSWTDQDVGSAGATGSGEENIKVVGAHTIVELMRHGMEPKEAGSRSHAPHRS